MALTATTLRDLHRIHVQLGDLRERSARGPKQIKAREAAVARLEEELAAARNQHKAARALLEQIAADEMANSVLADEILEAMEKVDELHAAIGEAESRANKGKEELAKVRAAVRDQQGLLDGDVKRLEGELREAETALPVELKDAYDRVVKSKGADAMAAVEGESCGGCYNTITPNMFNALYMGRIETCRNCGRLLYLPEDRNIAR
jgi:predicted  nucleic acid-binding Zn-ribbon protein